MDSAPLNFFAHHGDLVLVTFLDHATGDEAIICHVPGWIVAEEELTIKLRWWQCGGEAEDGTNHEHVTIVKSTIIHFEILKESNS
jgi:hypothetical protein